MIACAASTFLQQPSYLYLLLDDAHIPLQWMHLQPQIAVERVLK